MRPGRRALRVDVIGRRLAPADLLQGFRRAHPRTELDVATLFDAETAIEAVRSGTIDASFRAITMPDRLPEGVAATPVFDEPVQLLTGPGHELAAVGTIEPARLAGHLIWMPGIVPGTEWAVFYADLAAAFGLSIEVAGREFGATPLLEAVAGTAALATFVGERTRVAWPAEWGLRRIALRSPAPVYPHSLLWRRDSRHPALAALRGYLSAARPSRSGTWVPAWART